MQANPLWPVTERFPRLERDSNVDVVIVGAGIAGISCAFHLQNAGYKVLVLEKDEVGVAATGASSGILYYGSHTH
jgi:glycine/D-amino acid oxidase-like deaminating enzyme